MHISIEQFTAVSHDETSYWTSELLLNDDGSWSPKDLVDRLDCTTSEAIAALDRLTKAKLLRATSPGRYKTRQPGKFWTFPGRSKGMEPLLDRVRGYWDAMAKRRGGPFGERLELVRASSSVMRQYERPSSRRRRANLAATTRRERIPRSSSSKDACAASCRFRAALGPSAPRPGPKDRRRGRRSNP